MLTLLVISVSADRLPSQVPENQLFDVKGIIDATGMVDETSSLDWIIADGVYQQGTTVINRVTNYGLAFNPVYLNNTINLWNQQGVEYEYYQDNILLYLTYAKVPDSALDKPWCSYNSSDTWAKAINSNVHRGAFTSTHQDEGGPSIPTGKILPEQEVAVVKYKDHIITNGGKISENKHFSLDTKNQSLGTDNIITEKLITFTGTEGAHLSGEETYILDVAGGYEPAAGGNIRCIFSESGYEILPAFCNVVKAQSNLINFNTGQISTKGSIRLIGESVETPASLAYRIAVTPDSNSDSGFADGSVSTTFAGHILEARDNSSDISADYTWKDSTAATGGIKNFQKTFDYLSGLEV